MFNVLKYPLISPSFSQGLTFNPCTLILDSEMLIASCFSINVCILMHVIMCLVNAQEKIVQPNDLNQGSQPQFHITITREL